MYALLNIHFYLIALLIAVAVLGDYLVLHVKANLYRALFDNVTHASIGGISWLIICITVKNRHSIETLAEIALCTLISSFIDLDHFVAARSFHLKDATNLETRPWLHCSTFSLGVILCLTVLTYCLQLRWLLRFSLILFTAFASHHTRDAIRRGFWICPYGSTAPLSYKLYIVITVLIPYLVSLVMNMFSIHRPVFSTAVEFV